MNVQESNDRAGNNCTLVCDVFNIIDDLHHVEEKGSSRGLVSPRVFHVVNILLAQVSIPIIQVFGIVTNSINLRVFFSTGLKDVVTSCFFALSLSDLGYLLVSLVVWLCYILHALQVQSWIRLDELSFLCAWYANWLLAVSTLITTYIAVQRCCCVALPLKFKHVFTPKRNTIIIICLCLLTGVFYLPLQSVTRMKVFHDPSTNSSWLGVWYADKRRTRILEVTDYTVLMLFPITVQAINGVCLVIIIVSLRKSSRFRQATTQTGNKSGREIGKVKGEVKVKGKEIQVVKAVTCVTLIFIVSNVLPIIISATRRIVYDFQIHRNYRNLYLLVNISKDAILFISSSLNIVIYYRFNTTYRRTLKTAHCRFHLNKFNEP